MATVERLYLGGRLYRSRPGVRNLAGELFARLGGSAPEPPPDADSLLTRDGRIVAVGPARDLLRQAPAAERVELDGAVVLPGLVDTHCHLVSYGLARVRSADLLGARSIAEVQERLRRHLAATGIRAGEERWLLGGGFDQEGFVERRWITRADLDAVSTEVPICIRRVCGHALVANSAAIARAGIVGPVESPGGPDSLAQGILTEERMAAIDRAIPAPTAADYRQAAALATAEAAAVGFTGVHCLVTEAEEIAALRHLEATGRLPVRIRLQLAYAMLPPCERSDWRPDSAATGSPSVRSRSSPMAPSGRGPRRSSNRTPTTPAIAATSSSPRRNSTRGSRRWPTPAARSASTQSATGRSTPC